MFSALPLVPPGLRRALVGALIAASPSALRAQVSDIRSITPPSAGPLVMTLKGAQQEFEGFRRDHLPTMSFGRRALGECDEHVGRFCYWYDEKESPAPGEPTEIREARERLIVRLDSSSRAYPSDRWASGQLVRYLTEAGRPAQAVDAAKRCTADTWWCPALQGFALHAAGRFAASDSAYTLALQRMDEPLRCGWRDLKLLLDDELLKDYRDMNCRRRDDFERRIWWLSRPMMSSPGNDARTEYLSRIMMTEFLADAPSVFMLGFDADERELLLRYGWPRAWTRETGFAAGVGQQRVITGHEPSPAGPMLPMAASVRNPAFSDSLGWRGKGLPGVRARYAPDYARRILPLMHQAALFRRGDSALVVVSYDVGSDSALAVAAREQEAFSAALVLTKGEEKDATVVHIPKPGVRGTVSAKTAWAPMLMSMEVAAAARRTLARARYGLRASDLPGSRVTISDLLLFDAYEGMPLRLEDVLPHMRATQAIPAGSKIGIYWETYNTNPRGEGIQVAITVAPEQQDGSWLRRGLTALRLVREAKPVTVGMRDVSARGLGYTPRAVVVDLSTLKPGRYLLQLEITAEGTVPVRAERVLTVRDGG